jgi:hypothetical protein
MEEYLRKENEEDTEYTYNNHITNSTYKTIGGKPA